MNLNQIFRSAVLLLAIFLTACSKFGDSASKNADASDPGSGNAPNPSLKTSPLIHLNQVGFYATQKKLAAVINSPATTFSIISASDSAKKFTGKLSSASVWPYSEQSVKIADFSEVTAPGVYRVSVEGADDSHPFSIGRAVNDALTKASLKSFYFQRSSTELSKQYAGIWARPAGHPDTTVLVHSSAASPKRPEGSKISSPEGWYDAGDYNKYIVNSGISVYTLLAAYEHYTTYFNSLNTDIPESSNTIPDVLDEALWNIRWMLSMQDPADGGVYHKLTTKKFSGAVMPHEDTAERYVVQKSTAAALDFAATMAVASRIFRQFESELPGFATQCEAAAVKAWNWAVANPNIHYVQPADVRTGTYANPTDTLQDERAWAAAELYITMQNDSYYTAFSENSASAHIPGWRFVGTLAWISLAHHRSSLTPAASTTQITNEITTLADTLLDAQQASAYKIVMGAAADDFRWGSNSVALNQSMILLLAYQLTNNNNYLVAAESNLDYVLGRNAVGFSFVTGHGTVTPLAVHHRPSEADGIAAPIPGLIAGGPHDGQQDSASCARRDVSYSYNLPGLAYIDHWCSHATNEVAINWNAPLVYVAAALESIYAP